MGLKAGLFAAAAFVLLVPTFNALNAAHFEDVQPPFKFEPPEPPDLDDPPEGDTEIDVAVVGAAGSACGEITTRREEAYNRTFGGAAPGVPLAGAPRSDSSSFDVRPDAVAVVAAVAFREYTGDFHVKLQVEGRSVKVDETPSSTGDMRPQKNDFIAYDLQGSDLEPGVWTVAWEAQPLTGGGAVVVEIHYPECKATGVRA